MSRSRRRIAVDFVLATSLGVAAVAAVQAGDVGSSSFGESDADGLAESAHLPRDRQSKTMLAAAKTNLQAGRYAAAVNLLQRILDRADPRFIAVGSRYVSARCLANRSLAELPASALDVYEQQFGRQARRALQAAVDDGDIRGIGRVSVRYRYTEAGLDALRTLSSYHADHGRLSLTASGFRAVFEHPRSQPAIKAAALVRRIHCRHRLGDVAGAAALRVKYADELATEQVEIAGRPTMAADWLDSCCMLPRPIDAPSTADGPPHSQAALDQGRVAPSPERPSLQPAWVRRTGPVQHIKQLIDDGLDELEQHGIARLDSFQPLVAGNLVFARTMQGLIALDAETGNTIWQNDLELDAGRLADNLNRLENQGFRRMIGELLIRSIQADNIGRTLSTDGERLFAVYAEADVPDIATVQRSLFGSESQRYRRQKAAHVLAAFDLATGRKLWIRAAADHAASSRGSPMRETSFLGAPLAAEDALYALIRRQEQIWLYAVDPADGKLLWSLSLADEAAQSRADRISRQSACQLALGDGVLICPTGAGAVVAVDLLSRGPLWAYRYPRDDVPPVTGLPPGLADVSLPSQWWLGWRFPGAWVANGRAVLAGDESSSLYVFDSANGEMMWTRGHRRGLYVAGVFDSQVIVVERHAVRSFDLENGRPIWTADVGPPAGRGTASATHYYLPLDSGGIAAIDLADGSVDRLDAVGGELMGNLAAAGRSVVSQRYDRLALLPPLAAARRRAAERAAADPDDPQLMLTKALLDREAGNLRTAAAALAELFELESSETTRTALRETLLATLRTNPVRLSEVAPKIESLIESGGDRLRYLRALAAAHIENGDLRAALATYCRLLDVDGHDEPVVDGVPKRLVRMDRFVQGKILDLFALADDAQAHRLQALVESRFDEALHNPDPFALRRFADCFAALEWGHKARLELAARARGGRGFLTSQLDLLELSGSDEPQLAATALARLAELTRTHSYTRDAAAAYRCLLRRFADVKLIDGNTPRELIATLPQDSTLPAEIETGPQDPWPGGKPQIVVEEADASNAEVTILPVAAEPGSLFDRLSVYLVRTRSAGGIVWELRFQGDRQRGHWGIELPATNRSYRLLQPLHQGWGLGHVLILKLGAEIFGISPLDHNGEPQASILWHTDSVGETFFGPNPIPLRIFPLRLGFGTFRMTAVDRFGRTLAGVGAIRPGYLCYGEKGTLVALDPLTGGRLWQRYDVPDDALCAGDNEFVLLIEPEPRQIHVLRTVDGKTVATRPFDEWELGQLLTHSGRFVLVERTQRDGYSLTWVDLVAGTTNWSRGFAAGTIPFHVDSHYFGVLEPDGSMQILSLESGETLNCARLERLERLTGLFAVMDAHRLFVALSGPFQEASNQRANQQRLDFRRAAVNGPLYGFDRQTGAMLWKTRLTDAFFTLDQPKQPPLLIIDDVHPTGEQADGGRLSAIRCLDKRTGEQVYRFESASAHGEPSYFLETDIDGEWVELQTPTRAVRFDYAD